MPILFIYGAFGIRGQQLGQTYFKLKHFGSCYIVDFQDRLMVFEFHLVNHPVSMIWYLLFESKSIGEHIYQLLSTFSKCVFSLY